MNILQNLFKDEKAIIQEIHDSFDNAQEELLRQAYRIIETTKPQISNKAERLERLGFVNSNTVVKNLKRKEILLESKEDADLVNYYKSTYPFLKFLKEEQLESICKKYNLIYAPVSRYKEDVPEKNISEIESAQPLKSSCLPEKEALVEYSVYDWNLFESQYVTRSDSKDWVKKFTLKNQHHISESDVKDYLKKKYGYTKKLTFSDVKITKINKDGLFIAAPKSHFDLEGLKNQKLGFFNFTVTEVKDPIVFRYVRGGIQVLSKWGLEANDEMLQQENLN